VTGAFLATVLVSSVAGSLHCAAMCGPLVGMHGGAYGIRLALVHALGRLATYVTLGTLAGLVGGAVEIAGSAARVQHAATLVAGAAIVLWGVHAIAVARGWVRGRGAGGALFQKGRVQLRGKRPATRAWLVGALTGLLPCGWLWAFVIAAAGTGHAATGALVMAVFWLGTVPAMTGMLAFGGAVITRLRARLPVITACVLMALGLATLATRWSHVPTAPAGHHCHDGGAP
jgi:sulfite exporter TauE/SafE